MRIRLTTKYGVQHTTNPTTTSMVILTTLRFDDSGNLDSDEGPVSAGRRRWYGWKLVARRNADVLRW